jgi:hypothetical protein
LEDIARVGLLARDGDQPPCLCRAYGLMADLVGLLLAVLERERQQAHAEVEGLALCLGGDELQRGTSTRNFDEEEAVAFRVTKDHLRWLRCTNADVRRDEAGARGTNATDLGVDVHTRLPQPGVLAADVGLSTSNNRLSMLNEAST